MPSLAKIVVEYDNGERIEVDLEEIDSLFWTEDALEMLRPYYVQRGQDFDRETARCRGHWPCCHKMGCILRRLRDSDD